MGNAWRLGALLWNPYKNLRQSWRWYITIDLQETQLESKEFNRVAVERSEHDWFHCFLENGQFHGACGPFNLEEAVGVFREWAEEDCFAEEDLSPL